MSQTATLSWKWPKTKKARRQRQQLNDQLHTTAGIFWIRHYRRVKHHQLRKRLKKRY